MRRGTPHEDKKKKLFASSKKYFYWDERKTISCVQNYYKIAKTILQIVYDLNAHHGMRRGT
jgi:hypothetical protein